MMPLIGESLDFNFLLFKQQFKASLKQFYLFLIMLLKDNMSRLVKPVLSVHRIKRTAAEVPKLISLRPCLHEVGDPGLVG